MKKFTPIFSSQTLGLMVILLAAFPFSSEATPVSLSPLTCYHAIGSKGAALVSYQEENELLPTVQYAPGCAIFSGYAIADVQVNDDIFTQQTALNADCEIHVPQAFRPVVAGGVLLLRSPLSSIAIIPPGNGKHCCVW
ncbi:MAG: hypothetical protein ABIX01_12910 [Chitinophagaceae bacterium]